MDRDSDNPGMVEREMNETPVEREGMQGSGAVEREQMEGRGDSVEREGTRGSGSDEREEMRGSEETRDGAAEREGMRGGAVEGESLPGEHGESRQGMEGASTHTAGDMDDREQRAGGYGYDRPADIRQGSDRGGEDAMTVRPREGRSGQDDGRSGGQRGMEDGRSMGEDRSVEPGTSRDW